MRGRSNGGEKRKWLIFLSERKTSFILLPQELVGSERVVV